jgi:hypothetical protein
MLTYGKRYVDGSLQMDSRVETLEFQVTVYGRAISAEPTLKNWVKDAHKQSSHDSMD